MERSQSNIYFNYILVINYQLPYYKKSPGKVSKFKIPSHYREICPGNQWLPNCQISGRVRVEISTWVILVIIIYYIGDNLLSTFFRQQTISYWTCAPITSDISNRTQGTYGQIFGQHYEHLGSNFICSVLSVFLNKTITDLLCLPILSLSSDAPLPPLLSTSWLIITYFHLSFKYLTHQYHRGISSILIMISISQNRMLKWCSVFKFPKLCQDKPFKKIIRLSVCTM